MEPENSLPGACYWSISWTWWIPFTPSHLISWRSFLILSSHVYLDLSSSLFPSGVGVNNEIYISLQERDNFAWELSQCHLPNRVAGDNLSDAVQLWREGLLTNWEYLTQLNKMAGRSYNDLMQYPIFPFVLADYTSQVLDLTDPQAYRYFCALITSVTILVFHCVLNEMKLIFKFHWYPWNRYGQVFLAQGHIYCFQEPADHKYSPQSLIWLKNPLPFMKSKISIPCS